MKRRLMTVSRELGFKNLSKFAEALGVVPSYFSQLFKAGKLNKKFVENLKARFPEVNIEYLEKGEGEVLLPRPETNEETRRERLIKAIQSVIDELDEGTREIVMDAIKEYKVRSIREMGGENRFSSGGTSLENRKVA